MSKPLVIGHRGAMGHEIENTMASIEKALELGVDMIEIDVFTIKSGETVVFHDETLERLTDAEGKIEDYYYINLHKVLVGNTHTIPLLDEVLKFINHKVRVNIELKGIGTVNSVNLSINYFIKNKGWALNDFLISSFKWDELRKMRKINPNIPIAILTENDPLDAIPIAKELSAEAINPYFKMLNAGNSLTIKRAGFKIYTWTVNSAEDIINMKKIGVDGIFSNYPERIN